MTSAVNITFNDNLEEDSESDEKLRKKKHAKPKNFKCLSCEKSYSSRLDRNTHNLRVHKKPSDQICHVCGMKFHVIYDLTKHLSRVHGDAKNAKKILENCDYCGKSFSRCHLKDHIATVHEKQRNYRCEICSKSYTQRSALHKHNRAIHENSTKSTTHPCKKCDKVYTSKGALYTHVKQFHENVKNHECDVCHKGFFFKSQLTLHIKFIHEKNREFQCDQCSSSYNEPGTLYHHLKIVHGASYDLNCDFCGRKFISLFVLNQHLCKTHNQKPKYKCVLCQRPFFMLDDLTKHVHYVHDDVVQVCHCGKTFSSSDALKAHESDIHATEESPTETDAEKYLSDQDGNFENDDLFDSQSGSDFEIADEKEDLFKESENLPFKQELDDTEFDDKKYEYDGLLDDSKQKLVKVEAFEEIQSLNEISIQEKSKDKSFTCEKCEKVFNRLSSLKRHIEITHEGLKKHQCFVCSRKFGYASHLKDHMTRAHKDIDIKEDIKGNDNEESDTKAKYFHCKECDKRFSTKKDYMRHQNIHDNSGLTFKCEICCKEFRRKDNLYQHIRRFHEGKENETKPNNDVNENKNQMKNSKDKNAKCDTCEKSFGSAYDLQRHQKTHMEKSYLCTLCPKVFRKEDSLDHHFAKIHSDNCNDEKDHLDEQTLCAHCGSKFANKRNLQVHIQRIHEKIFQHQCDKCGKDFGSLSNLKRHASVHGESEAKYTCKLCQKSYHQSAHLTEHIKSVHEGVKPKCDQCGKEFYKKSNLKSHIENVHEGRKQYACPKNDCDKAYSDSKSLKYHLSRNH